MRAGSSDPLFMNGVAFRSAVSLHHRTDKPGTLMQVSTKYSQYRFCKTASIITMVGLLVFSGRPGIRAEKSVAVGSQKQLLVDDYVVAETRNLTRVPGQPRKLGVVMKPSVPTDFHPDRRFPNGVPESGGYHAFGRRVSVVWNDRDEKFQMLYRACGEAFTGYAESRDGLNWHKPQISHDGTSNLVTHRGKTQGTFYEAAFMIDPNVPWGHTEKYKAAFNPGNVKCAIAHSRDGIHWTDYHQGESVTGRAADTFNQILWDSIAQRFLLITRTDLKANSGPQEVRASRIMAHVKGNDLKAHPAAWETLTILAIDAPESGDSQTVQETLQMESLNVWTYENIYFGLMHVLKTGELTGSQGQVPLSDPDKRPDADVIDYYLGTSRNGKDFDLSWVDAGTPFIERGPDGSFDQAAVQPASEILTLGDEHWIYYTGMYHPHHSPPGARYESGKVGLARLPLDRFIGQQAGDEVGILTTRPFRLEGDRLDVNVSALKGSIRIEVCEESGQPIPALASDHQYVDSLRLKPRWSRRELSRLIGQTIRLRFTIRNATIYAFGFRN